MISSTDYFLYLPLMPQVAGGLLEPRHICVSLPRRLRKMRFVLGTANGQLMTTRLAKQLPGLAGQEIRWMLLDTAPRVLPELDPRQSKTAERVLRRRGVEVLTGESVEEAVDGAVLLPGIADGRGP